MLFWVSYRYLNRVENMLENMSVCSNLQMNMYLNMFEYMFRATDETFFFCAEKNGCPITRIHNFVRSGLAKPTAWSPPKAISLRIGASRGHMP